LILFLDDLQWADSSSLQFLNFLASYSPLQHVLLIGAYRENECLADQALSHLLEVFRELRPSSLTLSLKPLSIAAFTSLVADTLQMDPDHVSDLAALVFEKTGGNPYFCLQFLSSLHAESSLEFNFDKRAWQWDLVEIAGKSICSDLAELLARKLQGLQPDTQNFLSLAACWGSVFEPHKLAQFLDSTPEKIDSIVDEFLKQGLVCRRGETHQFAHDRIQEAAYALIPEPKRAALHLKIARVMQASSHDLFVTVGHYNHAAELLDGRERRQVALLNETAGQKAKAAAAFPAAAQYFAMARALLPSDIWAVEHELAFDLSFQEARCELASGHFEAGQLRLEHMNNEDLTLIERTRVSRLWIELFIGQGQMLNALDLGFQRLHQLGIQIPLHPASSEVDQEYQKFWDLLGSREIEEIVDLPLMTDLEKRETVALMAALVPPAFAVDFKLVAIIWCHLVNIVIEFGHCHTSVEAFGCFGLISQSLYDRFEEGYRFGKIAERLIDKHGFIAERVHSLGTLKHLAFWTRPISYALAYSEECNRAADEEGTNFLVCISRCHQVQFMLASGAPLETLIEKSEQITRFIQNRGFSTLALASSSLAFSLKSLSAGPPAAIMLNHEYLDEESFEARLDSFEITGIICFHYILKLSSHFISGEYAQAHAAGAKIRTRIWSVTSLPNLANYYFYYALTLAARHDTASEQERVQLTEELKVFAAKIETWAKSNPHTFMNKHALVGAEIARLEARDQEALKLYEQAGRLAREQGFVHEEALSYELTARFHASRGLNNFSLILIREARQAFERWGAQAKVMRLDRLYPELKSRLASVSQTSSSYHSSRIDLDSLLKSSRSISSELELKQLVQSLLEVVLVQAGADRAALAIMHDSELRLVASALMNSNAMDMDMSTDVSATSRPDILPAAVAHYVVRTQERVLLNAANRQAWFDLDATLKIQRPQSALCFPLTVQGQLIGLIYLENKTMSDVFTDDRIHILEVLAAQAAISIQHARLYQEVREQASRLHAILSSMADAVEVTGSDGHRLLSNEAFRQIFGNGEQLEIHASQSQVKTWQGETVAPSDLPRARAMRGEHVSHYGLRWINPVSGEEMFLQSSSTPVKDELDRNLGAVTVTGDLTVWVQLDKLKDEFLRVAAHELKTPVMIIKGYVQLLSRELQGIEGKKQTHLEAIESGTNRLSALTNALLDMSQAQLKRLRVNLEPLDLKALLLDCVHGIQVVSDRHKIRLLEVDPAVVLGSSMRLTQVLQNILGNAIKYSPDGGSVDVTMKVDSDWANVSVRDYGIGIPAAKQKQLFQMFFQAHIGTRHDFGGMGLGLYLVREIINLHHGDVWLTSEQGQGTTVSFRLPVARQV
jgi:PAS domain S-box-containing protein